MKSQPWRDGSPAGSEHEGYLFVQWVNWGLSPINALMTYLATYMLSDSFNNRIRSHYERASIPKINRSQLFGTEIPLPPVEVQRAIVAEIEAEQALVNANKQLIERFEAKIKAAIDRVWGEA